MTYPNDPNGNQPGYPYGNQPGYPGQHPGAPEKRPGTVIAAGVVLIVFGLIGGLARIAANVTTASAMGGYGDAATAAGFATVSIAGLLGALIALISGIMLLVTRSRGVRVFATIAAVILAATCIGLVATVAVPLLLWTSDSAKKWFDPQPIAPPGFGPVQY